MRSLLVKLQFVLPSSLLDSTCIANMGQVSASLFIKERSCRVSLGKLLMDRKGELCSTSRIDSLVLSEHARQSPCTVCESHRTTQSVLMWFSLRHWFHRYPSWVAYPYFHLAFIKSQAAATGGFQPYWIFSSSQEIQMTCLFQDRVGGGGIRGWTHFVCFVA